MRSPLQKELISCFKHEFEQQLPQFKRLQPKDNTSLWAWTQAPDLTFFVMVQPLGRCDQFTVEIAWSDDGKFPLAAFGRLKIPESKSRQRLSQLWGTGSEEPVWDLAPEKTAADEEDMQRRLQGESRIYPPDPPVEHLLPRVCPLVRDAVERFVQYGVPLFRRVAEHRGLNWPFESKVVV